MILRAMLSAIITTPYNKVGAIVVNVSLKWICISRSKKTNETADRMGQIKWWKYIEPQNSIISVPRPPDIGASKKTTTKNVISNIVLAKYFKNFSQMGGRFVLSRRKAIKKIE